MTAMTRLVWSLLVVASFFGTPQRAQQSGFQSDQIPLRPRITVKTRLAVTDFVARTSANSATQTGLQLINETLFKDLEFSGFFEIPSKSFYPLRPLRTPRDVVFENWQVPTLDVDFIVFGNLQSDATVTQVEAFLYDVRTRERLLGKRYTIADSSLIRRIAHEFADQVVFQLSAGESAGVARTQIAFASLRGDSKEIFTMDYDGHNARTVTANGGINKFPGWSQDNSKLAYVTMLPSRHAWQLWIQNLEGGHSILPLESPFVSSPAFSPDGTRVAFAARAQGRADADVFVARLDGTGLRNLSRSPAIETAPTWSPNGTQLAFVSDRSGSPQIWVMDADGSNVQRVIQEGGHCDSPDWSPDGRFIVYSWQAPTQWRHDIYIVEVASGRLNQLTALRGSNENPVWSPDGRHVAFQSDRSGRKQIFIMNRDGENLRQVTAYGINESPSWSGYEPLDPAN